MTQTYRSVVVVLVCVGVAIALMMPHGQVFSAGDKPAPAPASFAGRYQFFKNAHIGQPNEECLLDTATGKVWKLSIDNQRGTWVAAVEAPPK
jgi:hypothetical protein